MNDKLKIKISTWVVVISFFVILIIGFLISCIIGLRVRADDLQAQLDQYTKIEEQDLKPCPICTNEVKLNSINDYFYIECNKFNGKNGCGLKTGYYKYKDELIKKWNEMAIGE